MLVLVGMVWEGRWMDGWEDEYVASFKQAIYIFIQLLMLV